MSKFVERVLYGRGLNLAGTTTINQLKSILQEKQFQNSHKYKK